jgi:hypothetical protein
VTDQGDAEQVTIPVKAGQVVYSFAQGQLSRRVGADAPEDVLLDHVKSSRMSSEPRQQVTAWRWELELQPAQKNVRMTPLFTFETVAGYHPAP